MKRVLFLFLVALLLVCMAACGGSPATPPVSSHGTTPPEITAPPTTGPAVPPTTVPPVTPVTVMLDPGDGSSEFLSVEVTPGACYGTLPAPVREGYVFLGWFTQPEGGTLIDAETVMESQQSHTLYAHWEVQTRFTVTLDPNGGHISPYDAQLTVTIDQAYGTLPAPVRGGYVFQGWYTAPEDGTRVKDTTKFTDGKDLVLYAQWKYDALAYWTYLLQNRVEQIPQCRRVVVYLERTVGTKTYLSSDFLDDAGAINPAEGLEDYRVSDEWIRSVNPYIIIKLTSDMDAALVSKIGMLRRLPEYDIYIFPRAVVTGKEKPQLYYRLQLAKILYPEYFEDVDLAVVAAELKLKPKIYH